MLTHTRRLVDIQMYEKLSTVKFRSRNSIDRGCTLLHSVGLRIHIYMQSIAVQMVYGGRQNLYTRLAVLLFTYHICIINWIRKANLYWESVCTHILIMHACHHVIMWSCTLSIYMFLVKGYILLYNTNTLILMDYN